MLQKEKEVITAFLGTTLNLPADEVAALFEKADDDSEVLKADALNTLLEKNKGHIAKIKEENKTFFDNGFKKAQAETLSKFEKEVKEKFGVTDDKKGLELIEAIVETKATNTGAETDETKVKTSKFYLEMADKLKKEKDAAVKEWQDKYEGRENQLKKETTFKTISEKALAYIDSLNPVLPSDAIKAKNQKDILLNQIAGFEFDIKDDGKIIVLKDGKVVEDDHGHAFSFEAIVKQKADAIWDYKQGDERGGTGNSNDGTGDGKKGYKGPVPKSEAEYLDLMTKASDATVKEQITEAWRTERGLNKQ